MNLTVEVMLIYGFLPSKETLYYIWGNCITIDYSSEKRDSKRVKRKLHWMCCRLYPFVLLDKIKERTSNFSMHIAQIGWTMYICLFFISFFCILFPHLFYFFGILFFNSIITCKLRAIHCLFSEGPGIVGWWLEVGCIQGKGLLIALNSSRLAESGIYSHNILWLPVSTVSERPRRLQETDSLTIYSNSRIAEQ